MQNEEKLRLLEEVLDVEKNTLKEETLLAEIENYDSMTKLSIIVLCDDEFNKQLSGEKLNSFKKIKDILDFMG